MNIVAYRSNAIWCMEGKNCIYYILCVIFWNDHQQIFIILSNIIVLLLFHVKHFSYIQILAAVALLCMWQSVAVSSSKNNVNEFICQKSRDNFNKYNSVSCGPHAMTIHGLPSVKWKINQWMDGHIRNFAQNTRIHMPHARLSTCHLFVDKRKCVLFGIMSCRFL